MVLLGKFTGGSFETHDGLFRANKLGSCVIFDGAVKHFSKPFQGERVSLVLFLHKGTRDLPAVDKAKLRGLGFQWDDGPVGPSTAAAPTMEGCSGAGTAVDPKCGTVRLSPAGGDSGVDTAVTLGRVIAQYNRVFVHACCEPNSLLSRRRAENERCMLYDVTYDENLNDERTLEKIMHLVQGSADAIWFSPPCTGGSSWQRLNKDLGPDTVHKIESHQRLFRQLWRSFVKVAEHAISKGAQVYMELPRYCVYWTWRGVRSFLTRHGFHYAEFDGCMYSLTAGASGAGTAGGGYGSGAFIKKPWRIACINSCLHTMLTAKCNRLHEHEHCRGKLAVGTQQYTHKICKIVHKCVRDCGKHAHNSSNSVASCSVPAIHLSTALCCVPEMASEREAKRDKLFAVLNGHVANNTIFWYLDYAIKNQVFYKWPLGCLVSGAIAGTRRQIAALIAPDVIMNKSTQVVQETAARLSTIVNNEIDRIVAFAKATQQFDRPITAPPAPPPPPRESPLASGAGTAGLGVPEQVQNPIRKFFDRIRSQAAMAPPTPSPIFQRSPPEPLVPAGGFPKASGASSAGIWAERPPGKWQRVEPQGPSAAASSGQQQLPTKAPPSWVVAAAKAKMIEKLEKQLEESKRKLAVAEAQARAKEAAISAAKAMAAKAGGPTLGVASAAASATPPAAAPKAEEPAEASPVAVRLDAWGFPVDEPMEEEIGASGAGTAGTTGPPGTFYNPWDVMTEDAPFRTEFAKAQHEAGAEVPVFSAFVPGAQGVQGGPPPTPYPTMAPGTPLAPMAPSTPTRAAPPVPPAPVTPTRVPDTRQLPEVPWTHSPKYGKIAVPVGFDTWPDLGTVRGGGCQSDGPCQYCVA